MSTYEACHSRRFCRNRDRAIVAGVCAGIADYFGFNRRVTRLLAFIALLMATPLSLLIYFAIVLLVPSAPDPVRRANDAMERRRAARPDPAVAVRDVRRRYQSLDGRLARLERYVTSSRYRLDQEIRNL
jgi:phage shock protein C